MRLITYLVLIGSLLVFATIGFCDVYVVYNKATDEVLSISSRNDAVLPSDDYASKKVKTNIASMNLMYEASYYLFQDDKFVLNTTKLNDDQKAQGEYGELISERTAVEMRAMKNACEELEQGGVVFKHISCDDYK